MVAQLDRHWVRLAKSRNAVRLLSYAAFEGRPLTTKGSFANPVIIRYLRRLAVQEAPQPCKPIFLVGLGRSGTTVLGMTLGLHRQVAFLNEPKALWHVGVGIEDVIGSYSDEPGRLLLSAADASPAVVLQMRQIVANYLRLTRSSRLIDKYPELVYRSAFVEAIFPDCMFIVLQRNPKDVLYSISSWNRRKASKRADWWGADDRKWRILWREVVLEHPAFEHVARQVAESTLDDFGRAAVEWIASELYGQDLLDRLPDRAIRVKYENVIAEPEKELERLQRAVDLTPDPRVIEYGRARFTPRPPRRDPLPALPPALVDLLLSVADARGFRL